MKALAAALILLALAGCTRIPVPTSAAPTETTPDPACLLVADEAEACLRAS